MSAEQAVVNRSNSDLRNMSIMDIDNYGLGIQEMMTQKSTDILSRANMMELGSTKQELSELYDISKKHKKLMIPIIGKPLNKIRSIANNYGKVQDKIDGITTAIEEQKSRIDTHVQYMHEQIDNLDVILVNLRECEQDLQDYAEEIQDSPDQVRVQAVAQRLRNINGTRIVAEQAQAEAMMILAEQREARAQLEEVIKNAIPAIQIQAVNSVGIRVNRETQEIISKTRDIMGNVIVQNATEVKNMAEELQKNRTKTVVDDDKLIKAQSILEDALRVVTEASQLEASTNLKTVKDLQEKAKINKEALDLLSQKIGSN